MAETLTSKFGLRLYGAGTDTFTRTEYNANTQAVEDRAAWDNQGAGTGSRPTAAISGRYWYDTTAGLLYRDNGSAWTVVGSKALDAIFTSSGTSQVPLTAAGITSQTEDLFRATVAASVKARIKADGTINTVAGLEAASGAITGTAAGTVPLNVKGAASQSADMLQLQTSGGGNLFKVGSTGAVTSAFFGSGDGSGYVGNASASTVANMSLFSGLPAFEAYAKGGGAGSAFTDFMYLHHQAANSNVVNRRLGLLMKIGDETVGDAPKSGAIYIESAAASAGNPSLVLARGDAPALTIPATGAAVLGQAFQANGTVSSAPGTSAAHYAFGTGAIGQQSDNSYIKVGDGASSALYFYAAGSHNATPGNAGSGGVQLAQLIRSSSEGRFTTSRLYLDALGNTTPGGLNPTLRVGPSGAKNIAFDENSFQGFNNGAASELFINESGGDLHLGVSSAVINLLGRPKIDGHRVTISASAPSSPSLNDIWIDL